MTIYDRDIIMYDLQLQNLFKKYPDSGSGTRAREQLIETVQANIDWRVKFEKPIEEWLDTLPEEP